jgi:RNA polymerase sigma factor (TIGR02999 family)
LLSRAGSVRRDAGRPVPFSRACKARHALRAHLDDVFCGIANTTAITRLLNSLQETDSQAQEELILRLYDELRTLARRQMARESPDHTLQPTALVHEVWLRLIAPSRTKWENRAEFFSAAAEAMRRILVDHARRKQTLKRGGGLEREELDESSLELAVPADEMLAVDSALDGLSQRDPMVAQLVKLRYYVGMSMPEAAKAMGLSLRTAERLWTFGRAWLKKEIRSRT